jgi:succinoglycan biosynthesis transport protein ExoP
MPDNDRLDGPPAAGATAVQVRPGTELSTLVLSPAAAAATEDDETIHFRDLWRVVVKRKWVVISVFVIVLVTALVATMMAVPIYRAQITLKIEREAPKVIEFKGSLVTPEESGDADFYRTQYELLKSRTLAERVVEQLNLRQQAGPKKDDSKPWWTGLLQRDRDKVDGGELPAQEPTRNPSAATVGMFLGSLSVEPIRNSRLVRVFFDSPDRKLAADALNALAQNFINVNLERRYDASSYAKTFLEEKLAQTKAKLEESERALVEFQRDQQIINVDEKQNVLAQTLTE